MATKKTKQEKAIESYETEIREKVFGRTSDVTYHLPMLGLKYYNGGDIGHATAEERMDALCRVVLQIAEDISHIYRALEIYQKLSENFYTRQWEKIHYLAVEEYNLNEANKAERKREREAKKAADLTRTPLTPVE